MTLRFALPLALVALVAGPALAQPAPRATFGTALGTAGPAADVAAWSAEPVTVRRGARAEVRLSARVAPGWRVYAMESETGRPLTVGFAAAPAGLRLGAPATRGRPLVGFDEALGERYAYFADRVDVRAPLAAGRTLGPGRHALEATVTYAACNDRVCLPPKRVTLTVPVTVQ